MMATNTPLYGMNNSLLVVSDNNTQQRRSTYYSNTEYDEHRSLYNNNNNNIIRHHHQHQTTTATKTTIRKFDRYQYDYKFHTWKNKPFLKTKITCLFGIPFFNYSNKKASKKAWQTIDEMNMKDSQGLILCRMNSSYVNRWKSDILFSISNNTNHHHHHHHHGHYNNNLQQQQQQNEEYYQCYDIELVSGTFLSRVFEGSTFSCMLQWVLEMKEYVKKETGRTVNPSTDFYIFRPLKHHHQQQQTHNSNNNNYKRDYVVIFAKIDDKALPRAVCTSTAI